MNSRSGNVDLAKFIGSLLIMTCHLSYIKFVSFDSSGYYSFWIYVEFFLIITGYFTAKHFDNKINKNPIKESVIYTLKKFTLFLPYTIVCSFLLPIIRLLPKLLRGEISLFGFLEPFLGKSVFDIMLITNSFSCPLLGPLWYLSAMFIVFPLFTWLMQLRNRYWIMVISSTYSLLYYGIVGIDSISSGFSSLLRVIAGLCVGAFLYESIYIFYDYLNKINKIILTIIEIITCIIPILVVPMIPNYNNLSRAIMLCYTVCLAIMMPSLSYTKHIKGKFFNYLGKLSMPMFIIHMLVVECFSSLEGRFYLSDVSILFVYYGGSIIVSMIAMYFVDHWKWFQRIISKPIELKD